MKPKLQSRTGARSLVADESGAIVVVAVFMATFLVGCLWYLIGIGDAAVYRQKMQAGADASVYASAVYHARGMNMIAMINLNMAALVAVLVASKTLKAMMWTAAQRALAQCAANQALVPPETGGCGEANAAADLWRKLNTIIAQVETTGNRTLKNLSISQQDIARTAPWIAFARSTQDAAAHGPWVQGGSALSMAMSQTDTRMGLPVEREEFSVVCTRAQRVSNMLITQAVPPILLRYLNGSFPFGRGSSLRDSYPDAYCDGASSSVGLEADYDPQDVCKDTLKGRGNGNGNGNGGGGNPLPREPPDKPACDLLIAQCVTNLTGLTGQALDDMLATLGYPPAPPEDEEVGAPILPEEKTTKQIYRDARNGNDFFQIYAVVHGETATYAGDAKGVEVAAHGGAVAGDADEVEKIAVAQAEFYYDQTPALVNNPYPECWTPPCSMEWDGYKENVLWNMRWRARLRRWKPPGDGADVNILETLPAPDGDIQRFVAANAERGAVTRAISQRPTLTDMATRNVVGDALGGSAGDVDSFIGGAGSSKTIH